MRTERLEESLLIYAFIICGTRGCKWGLSRRRPGRTPLLLLGELGQSPRPPKTSVLAFRVLTGPHLLLVTVR